MGNKNLRVLISGDGILRLRIGHQKWVWRYFALHIRALLAFGGWGFAVGLQRKNNELEAFFYIFFSLF